MNKSPINPRRQQSKAFDRYRYQDTLFFLFSSLPHLSFYCCWTSLFSYSARHFTTPLLFWSIIHLASPCLQAETPFALCATRKCLSPSWQIFASIRRLRSCFLSRITWSWSISGPWYCNPVNDAWSLWRAESLCTGIRAKIMDDIVYMCADSSVDVVNLGNDALNKQFRENCCHAFSPTLHPWMLSNLSSHAFNPDNKSKQNSLKDFQVCSLSRAPLASRTSGRPVLQSVFEQYDSY